jgi:hypothetical protein
MLKKMGFGILLLFMFIIMNCSIVNPPTTIDSKDKIQINLVVPQSKGSIVVNDYLIVKADITVTAPDSTTETQTWTTGAASKLFFANKGSGAYTIAVTETDEVNNSNSYSTSFTVGDGHNVILTIHLGGNIIVDVIGDSTTNPTAIPTSVPTAAPTDVPTAAPTDVPTSVPTDVPTSAPTAAPVLVSGALEYTSSGSFRLASILSGISNAYVTVTLVGGGGGGGGGGRWYTTGSVAQSGGAGGNGQVIVQTLYESQGQFDPGVSYLLTIGGGGLGGSGGGQYNDKGGDGLSGGVTSFGNITALPGGGGGGGYNNLDNSYPAFAGSSFANGTLFGIGGSGGSGQNHNHDGIDGNPGGIGYIKVEWWGYIQ